MNHYLVRKSGICECSGVKQRFQIKRLLVNVIFVDESSIEMQSSSKIFFNQKSYRMECPTRKVPKPKHPYTVCYLMLHVLIKYGIQYTHCMLCTSYLQPDLPKNRKPSEAGCVCVDWGLNKGLFL